MGAESGRAQVVFLSERLSEVCVYKCACIQEEPEPRYLLGAVIRCHLFYVKSDHLQTDMRCSDASSVRWSVSQT